MPRFTRRILAITLCLAGLGMATMGEAAQSQSGDAKPKPPPIVAIKKSDGATLRGVIEKSDGKQITIKPVKGNAFGDPEDVAWADVKSVSNGLTQQKALDAWKLEHKSDLCADCRGDARVACATCKGTGHDPAASADCKTCKGELLVDCPEKRCEAGKVPCPAPCLKLSEGTWSKPDAGGKRWRNVSVSGASLRVSDGHLGEIPQRPERRGMTPVMQACTTCDKTTLVACPTCGGDDKAPCPACKANKSAADCADCDAGLAACKACGETGLKSGAPAPAPAAPAAPEAPTPPAKIPADNNDGF